MLLHSPLSLASDKGHNLILSRGRDTTGDWGDRGLMGKLLDAGTDRVGRDREKDDLVLSKDNV